jgi:glyoxylase-like metal-dependent hydrolase (beta-lactamase superfamily II)
MQRHFVTGMPQPVKPLSWLSIVVWLVATRLRAQDAKAIVEQAIAAIHAQDIQSIEINGRGFDALFGQAYDGDSAWPRFALTRFSLAINYRDNFLRDERTRVQSLNPPLGGGNQPIGEQRQTLLFREGYAWNLGHQGKPSPAQLERDLRSPSEARQTEILFTPQGFLEAALHANPTVHTEKIANKTVTLISFVTANKIALEGTLDEHGHLQRIRTWVGTPVLGDVVLDSVFSEYQDFDGVAFPRHIVQSEGGYPLLDVTVTSVKANSLASAEVPQGIRQTVPRELPAIKPQPYGEGVWIIPGEDYHASKSILVEFKDYLLVVEGPDSEERSLAVIDAVHKLVPGKPIRYIVNTHTHFDHSGGLRTYAAEGAAIVTWEGNVSYYRQVWSNPYTIHPDRLAKSKRTPLFEGLVGSRTFTDGNQELIVFHYAGNFHNPGMLAIYLPRQRALIEADSFNPQPDPGDPPTAIPNLVQFYGAVQKLGLDVDQIIPIHGRITPFEEGLTDIAAYKNSQLWQ